MRTCFLSPPSEAIEAAGLLKQAQIAHSHGNKDLATDLIKQADMPSIRAWTESLWGKASPHVMATAIAMTIDFAKIEVRMPNTAEKAALHQRDGYHCRFCGLPLVRAEVRKRISLLYPEALTWGRTNLSQHAAFQAMWVQYDHLLPHAKGGTNELDNLVITCAPCNFARMDWTLDEVGISNPFLREPIKSDWDGLEAFR